MSQTHPKTLVAWSVRSATPPGTNLRRTVYHAQITRLYDTQEPEIVHLERKGSMEIYEKVQEWIGEMITTWQGTWELTCGPVGHPEAGNTEYIGKRLRDENGDDGFPVSFTIISG